MNNDEVLQLILSKLDGIEQGQKAICDEQKVMNRRLDTLEEGQKAICDEQKVMNRRLDTLEEGQKVIRRDVAQVNRKLDRLSADVGDTLVYITDNVYTELELLKKAK